MLLPLALKLFSSSLDILTYVSDRIWSALTNKFHQQNTGTKHKHSLHGPQQPARVNPCHNSMEHSSQNFHYPWSSSLLWQATPHCWDWTIPGIHYIVHPQLYYWRPPSHIWIFNYHQPSILHAPWTNKMHSQSWYQPLLESQISLTWPDKAKNKPNPN